MQLERLLRSQGFGSRPVCRSIIDAGRVCIGAQVITDPLLECNPQGFEFSVDGVPWIYREFAYLMLHKPAHYECSHHPQHYPSIYSLLPAPLLTRGVQAVGRLDEDTTGLLLLSDNGQFIHRYTSPKKKVGKVYLVEARHPVTQQQADILMSGVLLHGETRPVQAVACEIKGPTLLELSVTEGKYHMVKRMVAAAGNRVDRLHRVSVGDLLLPADLPAGQWRWLDAHDLHVLGWA